MSDPSPATVAKVMQRDQGRCAWCGDQLRGDRGIHWSIQHRVPRSAGGTKRVWVNLPANLVPLCGSGTTGCHGKVESYRASAIATGFLVSAIGRARADETAIVHAVHGHVFLDDEGGVTPVGAAVV